MKAAQKRMLCNWLTDLDCVKEENTQLNNILPGSELKVSVSPENTGANPLPNDIKDLKFIGVYTIFPKKGNMSVVKELSSKGYDIWEHTSNSKKIVTANKVLNIEEEFSKIYDNMIQCTICNNTYPESMVNITDHEDDVCIHCEGR